MEKEDLKIGDRIKIVGENSNSHNYKKGIEYTVVEINSSSLVAIDDTGWRGNYLLFKNAELVNNTSSMSIINKFKLARKSEPEKSFIEKGLMTIDEKWTPDGKELFDLFLYDKNKAEFKKEVVDKLPKDEEKA